MPSIFSKSPKVEKSKKDKNDKKKQPTKVLNASLNRNSYPETPIMTLQSPHPELSLSMQLQEQKDKVEEYRQQTQSYENKLKNAPPIAHMSFREDKDNTEALHENNEIKNEEIVKSLDYYKDLAENMAKTLGERDGTITEHVEKQEELIKKNMDLNQRLQNKKEKKKELKEQYDIIYEKHDIAIGSNKKLNQQIDDLSLKNNTARDLLTEKDNLLEEHSTAYNILNNISSKISTGTMISVATFAFGILKQVPVIGNFVQQNPWLNTLFNLATTIGAGGTATMLGLKAATAGQKQQAKNMSERLNTDILSTKQATVGLGLW